METLRSGSLGLFGGRLCLDFVNTANRHGDGIDREFLETYDDLVAWGRHVGLLASVDGRAAARFPEADTTEAALAFDACLQLRECLHRLLLPGGRRNPAGADLERLNQALTRGAHHSRLVADGEGFAYAVDDDALAWLMGSVAWSASELLTSGQIDHVKTCPGTHCGWLFLDTSRGHTRRWCSMTTCGNRAKARAHYERHQV